MGVAVFADDVPTAQVNEPLCTPALDTMNSGYSEDEAFCSAVTPLSPPSDEVCSTEMICTETAALTGPADATNEATCRSNSNEGDCVTESVDCTWMQRCEYDAGRAQCNAEDVPGEAGLLKYLAALSPVMVMGITLGIAFPLVVFVFFYVPRCFNCCGGRKANKGICPIFNGNGMCPNSADPALVGFRYSAQQIRCFKLFFLLFFLITLVGGIVGMAGNSLLASGLQGTIDTFIYELAKTVDTVERVFTKIVELDDSNQMDDSMIESIAQIKCFVASSQVAISESAAAVLDLRTLVVLVVCLIPMALTALGVLAAVCNSKHLSCCIAVVMSLLLVVVWISFGLHGYLAMIFGDLCLEMDLSLHFEDGQSVVVPFLPNDMNPCSGDSGYDSMFDEVEAAAGEALPEGAEAIRKFCNKEGDFEQLKYFEIDCSDVSGEGKMLTGTAGSYTVNANTQLTLDVFKLTKQSIMVEDPGINPQMLEGVTLASSGSCTADAEAYDGSTMAGRCPDRDPNGDCLPGCGTAKVGADNDVLDLLGGGVPGLEISSCPDSAMKSLEDCGSLGPERCGFPKLQQLACLITGGMDALAKLANFLDLLDNEIKPILRCENVKGMFKSMYMPLCVDSMNGFGLVTASNGLGGVIMLLMVPFSIIATKRLDKTHRALKTDVKQDASYTGASAGM